MKHSHQERGLSAPSPVALTINAVSWMFLVLFSLVSFWFSMAFSPYTAHTWYSLLIQLLLSALPVVCFVLSFWIRPMPLKLLFLIGNAALVYWFTFSYLIIWSVYWKLDM